jgi:signal transduction histidine kinase
MLLYVVVSILLAFVVYFAFKFFEKRKNNEILHLLHQQQMFEIETQKALTQTQINERNRIAQEMHDDLGSSLTSVSMAVEMFNQNPNNTKSIQTINQSIGNLHQQVNEIVWSLNMRNDKVQNLLAYIHRFARNFLEEAHISLHWEESDDFKNIPIEGIVRRTLYLSSKELLNNIVKHAQASNVWISVNLEGRVMQLTIKDDGQGFDVNQVVTEEGNGNGLKNLQQNIQIINGTIEWKNENGTIVVIQCNL